MITKPAIERAVLHRLSKKASIYSAELGVDGEPIRVRKSPNVTRASRGLPAHKTPIMDSQAKALPRMDTPLMDLLDINEDDDEEFSWRVDVDEVRYLYEQHIIPLTKEVEVRLYLG